MSQLRRIAGCFLLLVMLCTVGAQDSSGDAGGQRAWKLAFDKQGIKVYTRPHAVSSYNEAKVETRVQASLANMMAVMDDIPSFPQWMENCHYTERLVDFSRTSGLAYMIMTAPWPFHWRDVVYRFEATQDQASKIIRMTVTHVPDYLPPQKDYVRVPLFSASWELIPLPGGYVDIVYVLHFEAGGVVPAAIANMVLTNAPYVSILRLKEHLKKPEYRNAVLPEVLELEP